MNNVDVSRTIPRRFFSGAAEAAPNVPLAGVPAMPPSEQRGLLQRPQCTVLESVMRGVAERIGKRRRTIEVQSESRLSMPEPQLSASDLVQRFDHVYDYDHMHPNLAPYLRRDAIRVRSWLQDMSQPVPLIARQNLESWAIPHLLHIVKEENRRRASELHQSGSSATTMTESFVEGADAHALLKEENALAALLDERTPPEERCEQMLAESIAEKTRIEGSIAELELLRRGRPQPMLMAWMNKRTSRRQRRELDMALTQVEGKIHLLREEIEQKARGIQQRKSEVDAYRTALHRAFSQTRQEATDRLSELPILR